MTDTAAPAPASAAPPAASSATGSEVATSTATSVNSTPIAIDVPAETSLNGNASLSLSGLSDMPVAATALSAGNSNASRTYFVDSRNGNDINNGLAETPGTDGNGPWKTLARVTQSTLGPGDTLRLACGGEWNETLRLPASGGANRPVTVTGASATCAVKPAINGGVALATASWTVHSGKVFKVSLDRAPLLLASSDLPWSEAHHPNRGYLAADPNSPYLTLAADGNGVADTVGSGSTVLSTGSDLVLPAGTNLANGARMRVRTGAWLMDESPITAFASNRVTLANRTSLPIKAGWGYLLLGQLWMVDSAGEWFYDPTAKMLYAYMASGLAPSNPVRATVLATGIDLTNLSQVVVDGLAVRNVGTGADLRGTQAVVLRNSVIEDVANNGVDATGSNGLTIESSAFMRSGADAISGWRDGYAMATAMTIRNNLVRDSGVQMQGEQPLSLPRRSYAAIYAGPSSTITGNVVVNAGYIGIRLMGNSLVENNFVFGACSVLDDCAGIYIWSNKDSVIRGNTVARTRGALAGKSPSEGRSLAHGIYLDEMVTGVTVERNTVIDADNGILLHVSANNIVRNNRLYANRQSQIWMQATANQFNAAGDVFGNTVEGNLIAAIYPGSTGLLLDTAYASVAGFGSFDRNRYLDRTAPTAVAEISTVRSRGYTFAQWQDAMAGDMPLARDTLGSAVSGANFATYRVASGNLVPNASLANNAAGWGSYNAVVPYGTVYREACPAGTCLRYVAGGSSGGPYSPNFAVVKGQWYRLTVDLSTQTDNQLVYLIVRRGGGGNNGFESLSSRSLTLNANRAWQRNSMLFQATQTINVSDPITGDYGARFDIEGIASGQSVSLANVELVAVAPDATSQVSGTLINIGATAQSFACPTQATLAALCGKFKRLSDDTAITWPASVAAFSSLIYYGQEPTLVDSDGDGIPDVQDQCPGTPAGTAVNASGCGLTLQ